MGIACPLLAASLLLCSLLAIASANDYGVYDSSKTQAYGYGTAKPVNQQQVEKEEKTDYGSKSNVYKSQPEEKGKPLLEATASIGYGTKSAYKPQPEKPDYGTKPNSYKPQPDQEKEKPMPEETENSGYSTKPEKPESKQEEKPESKQEEKPDYGTKPNYYEPQPDQEKEKPIPEETEKSSYSKKPIYQPQPEKPESKEEEKPDYGTKSNSYKPQPDQEKEKPLPEETEKSGYSTKPVYQPQPEKPDSKQEEKPDYGTKPNYYKPQPSQEKEKPIPEETENSGYSTKPVYYQPQPVKPESKQEEKPDYGTKPNYYKPQPEETEKPTYTTKPIYQPQPENEEKPGYDAKNDFNLQLPEDKENPKLENEEHPNYNANPVTDFYKPKPEVLPVGVEGLVLCKSGPKHYPIRGALTRITCLTVDENGHEKTHSVCSGETDEHGYFLARLSPSGHDDVDLWSKLRDCKAFLESSPLETCNVPVDVNKGISGAPLSGFRVLHHMGMKLFSVGPFFFTPQLTPVPNGY
ncbi:adhesive plaque matrix protein-like [Hibiscus syriacus]|uniref:adhesive plaque matrix protein-like n=1 Tax=Hibiscus syriacus TaxID=106335 RepID=UPI00192179B0|nr:adhesive plaque matrix protein-like [Hibiscus syriacus]